jgi:hypothetical protein
MLLVSDAVRLSVSGAKWCVELLKRSVGLLNCWSLVLLVSGVKGSLDLNGHTTLQSLELVGLWRSVLFACGVLCFGG